MLSSALDLVDPEVYDHHFTVAYIALSLAEEAGYSLEKRNAVFLAALYHDIGAVGLEDKKGLLVFDALNAETHSVLGYNFLRKYPIFRSIALLIRYHHTAWAYGKGARDVDTSIPEAAHLLHLADRVAVLINRNKPLLDQIPYVSESIRVNTPALFSPDLFHIWEGLSGKKLFWSPLASRSVQNVLQRSVISQCIDVTLQQMEEIVRLYAQIIDYRSPFTFAHSSSTAALSVFIAQKIGLPSDDIIELKMAAYLHDIGSLGMSAELINKKNMITPTELNIIQSHSFNSYILLKQLAGFERIALWAGHHHESLNGKGYPFGKKGHDISLPAQVLRVTEMFCAMREDRAYRAAYSVGETLRILRETAQKGEINSSIVDVLMRESSRCDQIVMSEHVLCKKDYDEWRNI
jgi:putative nucleotidyltransferase with HDIG domain